MSAEAYQDSGILKHGKPPAAASTQQSTTSTRYLELPIGQQRLFLLQILPVYLQTPPTTDPFHVDIGSQMQQQASSFHMASPHG